MTEQELNVQKKQETTREESTRPGRTYVPPVDIFETPQALWVRADMPGVDDQLLNVQLADGVLTIEGQVSLKDYENLEPVYTEYNIGNYLRRFTLSNDIDTEHIQGRMRNGVLELELPKQERAKPRKIEVKAS